MLLLKFPSCLGVLLRRQRLDQYKNVNRRLHSSIKTNDGMPEVSTVVLLRHGQSTFNASPTFTGWCDPPLTDRGIVEAKAAGVLLNDRGFNNFDIAFTSNLSRAIHTCELVLDEIEPLKMTPLEKYWQLNERHYGALQGFKKDDPDLIKKYGSESLIEWRRSYTATPPAMDKHHPHFLPEPAPLTESLADCQDRVVSFWEDELLPALKPGKSALLVAHANTLRALVAYLDGVKQEMVPNIHIPNSVPCVYKLNTSGASVSPLLGSAAGGSYGQWLFSAENHSRLQSTIGGSGSYIGAIFEAWDLNGDGELSLEEIQIGLRGLKGDDDVAVNALAAKLLEEIDKDGSDSLDFEEFQSYALKACQKLIPGLV